MSIGKLTFILCLNITFGYLANAQIYEQGYVVRASGDTLKGSISIENLGRKSVLFRKNDGTVQTFRAIELRSFYYQPDNDHYVSAIVDVDVKPINQDQLENNDPSPKYVRDTVMLRVVARGKATLYTFKDKDKEHFFLQMKGDSIYELLNIKYFIPLKNTRMDLESYKQQLKNELTGCSLNFLSLYFTEKDLEKIVNKYNQCAGESFTAGDGRKITKTSFYLTGGASFNLSNSFSGSDLTFNLPHNVLVHPRDMSFSHSTNAVLGIGLRFKSSKPSNHISFGTELLWRNFSTEATHYYNEALYLSNTKASMNLGFVQLNFITQMNFSGKLNPFINLGLSLDYYYKRDTDYSHYGSDTGIPYNNKGPICNINPLSYGAFLGTGVNYKKFLFTIRGELLPIYATSTDSGFLPINLNILLGYYISK